LRLAPAVLLAAAFAAADPALAGTAVGEAAASGPGAVVTSYSAGFFAAAQPTTALDMVQLLPGFVYDPGDSVRGYVGSASNVLLDGERPASKDDSIDEVLRRIPASRIARIDVIRGGAPGIDMHGKTVIANLIRRTDQGGRLTVTASGTRAADDRYQGVGRAEGELRSHGWFFEGSAQIAGYFDDTAGIGPKVRLDGLGNLIVTGQEAQQGVEDDNRLTGAVERDAMGGKLRLSASFTATPYAALTVDTLTQPAGGEFDNYHQRQDTAEFGARLERPIGSSTTMEAVLLEQLGWGYIHDDFTEDPQVAVVTGDDTSDLFDEQRRKGESIASAKFRTALSPTLSLNTGGEADYNWLTADTVFIENGIPVLLPAADVHVTEERGEVFALADWRPRPSLNLVGGLRMEASRLQSFGDFLNDQTFVYAKPRLLLTFSPTPVDQIRLRVEREVGQLNFDNFTASTLNIESGQIRVGNPKLEPQSDWVFEAVAERRFWNGGDLSLTARQYELFDVIDRVPIYDPAGTFDAPGNIGSGRKEEVAVGLTLPLERVGLPGALITAQSTWRWSRVIDPTTGQPRPISALPPNTSELHFTQGMPRFKASWGATVVGETSLTNYRFDEIDIDKLRPSLVVWAEYKPHNDLAFRLEGRDANDRDFFHERLVYNGPRDTYPLAFTEMRDLRPGRYLYFRVLKSFN
jgi:outer membrane receptor protein involved in Fe transport